jgi:hypothetical protein
MGLETVTANIITFMRQYMADPTGENRTWIYPSMPKVTADFPEVSLTNVGSVVEEIGLGNNGQRYTYMFELDIWVKKENTVSITKTVNNAQVSVIYSGRKLLEYVSDNVTNIFYDNRDVLLDTYDIIDIELSGHYTHPFEEEIDCFRKSVRLSVIANRE